MKKDHPDLSLRRQCSLLSLARSTPLLPAARGKRREPEVHGNHPLPGRRFALQICREGTGSSWRRRGMARVKWLAT